MKYTPGFFHTRKLFYVNCFKNVISLSIYLYVLSLFEGPANYLPTLDSWEIYQSVPHNPKVARNLIQVCVTELGFNICWKFHVVFEMFPFHSLIFLEIIILCKQLQKRDLTINLFVCTFFIWRTCKFMRNLPISSIQPQSSQELNSGVCYRVGFQYLLKISCGVWSVSISLSV